MSLFALCSTGCSGLQLPLPRAVQTITRTDQETNPEQRRAYKALQHPTRLPLAYAKMQEQLGNLIEARKHYEHVMIEDSKSADAILGLARVDQLSGRTVEAERGFRRALELRPSDPRVLDAVGQFFVAEKRWGEAIQMLNTAMLRNPSEKVYRYHLAVALAKSGDIKGCLPHFEKSVGDAEAHYNVGYILMDQGRLDEAQQQFRIALSKKPNLKEAHVLLQEVMAQLTAPTSPAAGDVGRFDERQTRVQTVAAQYTQTTAVASGADRLQPGHSVPQMSSVVSNSGLSAPLATHADVSATPNQRVSASIAYGPGAVRSVNAHDQP
ncbi:MAG: tetratricopeptide repeat protein [Planctomycetaceae bacterium]